MQRLAILIAALLSILFIAGLAQTAGAVLGPDDNGKEIRVQAGDVIELALKEQAGTGYTWEFHNLDAKFFKVLHTDIMSLSKPNRVGGPLLRVWRLQALKPGSAVLSLDYLRPWEGRAKAVKHFQINVHIH